jgi:hypothetical protein
MNVDQQVLDILLNLSAVCIFALLAFEVLSAWLKR